MNFEWSTYGVHELNATDHRTTKNCTKKSSDERLVSHREIVGDGLFRKRPQRHNARIKSKASFGFNTEPRFIHLLGRLFSEPLLGFRNRY
jgi:hypothetical protein